jgi:hypothetical protein
VPYEPGDGSSFRSDRSRHGFTHRAVDAGNGPREAIAPGRASTLPDAKRPPQDCRTGGPLLTRPMMSRTAMWDEHSPVRRRRYRVRRPRPARRTRDSLPGSLPRGSRRLSVRAPEGSPPWLCQPPACACSAEM